MTSTNETTYTLFQKFQSDQTSRFLDFQKNQFEEFMLRYPSEKTTTEITDLKQTKKSKEPEKTNVEITDLEQPEKPKLKLKKLKAPKKPKRARTAYTFFSQKENKSMKEKNPTATFGELSKLISVAWKKMNVDDKQQFIKLAKQDKIRADKEKEEWDKTIISMANN